jgi:murein DD-endopeptidase MepM/ murein hydrolase activator NlpD
MFKIIFIVLLIYPFFARAEQYMVSGDNVNFRSGAKFSGSDNIIKKINTGDRLVLVNDYGDYIEATLVPDGTKGFVWKDYVELSNTHDYYKSTSNTFPTVTPETEDPNIASNASVGMPICGCSGCSRSSKYGIRKHPISGRRRMHHGCDVRAAKGTNVYAIADGKVKFAGNNDGYGKTVDIEHLSMLKGKDGKVLSNRGYTTRNAHLWKIHVSKGQNVKKGQRIGQVNSTGASTGHHLHFEIAVTGTTIDPEKVIDINDVKKSCSSVGNETTGTVQ